MVEKYLKIKKLGEKILILIFDKSCQKSKKVPQKLEKALTKKVVAGG